MKRVTFTSIFTEATDNLLISPRGVTDHGDLSSHYDACDIGESLASDAQAMCEVLKIQDFEVLIRKDQRALEVPGKEELYYINSVVGDDEHTTTESAALGPLLIVVGPRLSRIKLSRKDTGISADIGNYAEGWILIPPTAESSFEAVNRRHQREGVPFVLDGVKLKLISPVRKMSQMDTDLESKMRRVAESAAYVNRNWFTYDYHQMALIFAQNVFDFRDSRSFPYLYATEGGCGGLPPYSNVDTMLAAIHTFHKGKAKRTILGIMYEAVECHNGALKPNETFFLRSSHIAQMGDQAWLEYDRVYRTIVNGGSRIEAKNRLNMLAGKAHIPQEILEKGTEVSPHDVRVGTAISHLRNDGFIMTELDVKMMLENRKKLIALGGEVPFEVVLREIEEEKAKFKSNSWTVLGSISQYLDSNDFTSLSALEELPTVSEDLERARGLAKDYYALRSERYGDFTSFAYTDAIRVFKTSDVEDYIKRTGNVLRTDIAMQISVPIGMKFSSDIISERLRKERIFKWVNSRELTELLEEPLPPGIGPDDSRILTNILGIIRDVDKSVSLQTPTVIILISGDRKLARGLYNHAKQAYGDKRWLILTIEPVQYIAICLSGIRALHDGESWVEDTSHYKLWNFITGERMGLPPTVSNFIKDQVRMTGARNFAPYIEFDYPNLERQLESMSNVPNSTTVSLQRGGYLRAESLLAFSRRSSWASLSLNQIYAWHDFSSSARLVYPLRGSNIKGYPTMINNPIRPDFYRSISSWSRKTER